MIVNVVKLKIASDSSGVNYHLPFRNSFIYQNFSIFVKKRIFIFSLLPQANVVTRAYIEHTKYADGICRRCKTNARDANRAAYRVTQEFHFDGRCDRAERALHFRFVERTRQLSLISSWVQFKITNFSESKHVKHKVHACTPYMLTNYS